MAKRDLAVAEDRADADGELLLAPVATPEVPGAALAVLPEDLLHVGIAAPGAAGGGAPPLALQELDCGVLIGTGHWELGDGGTLVLGDLGLVCHRNIISNAQGTVNPKVAYLVAWCYLGSMPPPSGPTKNEVVEIVRRIGREKALVFSRRHGVQDQVIELNHDLESIAEFLASVESHEITKHDFDDKDRPDYIVVMRMHYDGELPIYLKLALPLPEMETARLLSFKLK
jgi:hypothetical protein